MSPQPKTIEIDKREGGRLGHEQLQAVEHSNRMIAEHLALMKDLSAQVDTMVDTFIPLMKIYVERIHEVRKDMTAEVLDIMRSSRELGELSKKTPELIAFAKAVEILTHTLTPEVIGKLRAVLRTDHE